MPARYEVYWKVRNSGDEARMRGQLRAEIRRRGERITETTAYTGRHWVECYIVRTGSAWLARASPCTSH